MISNYLIKFLLLSFGTLCHTVTHSVSCYQRVFIALNGSVLNVTRVLAKNGYNEYGNHGGYTKEKPHSTCCINVVKMLYKSCINVV